MSGNVSFNLGLDATAKLIQELKAKKMAAKAQAEANKEEIKEEKTNTDEQHSAIVTPSREELMRAPPLLQAKKKSTADPSA